MKPISFLFFFLIFFSKISFIKSSECLSKKNLNIGLLKNEYIDYEPYLYYELGNFTLNSETSFNLELVENNEDKFDIIFGEYYDLKKFHNRNLTLNNEILDFYKKNNIEIFGNILPLDLDTFIILSKNIQERLTLDELSNFYSPTQYSLGINLEPNEQFIKLITYNLNGSPINNTDIYLEYLLSLYTNTYININKNIIESNFLELFESFENYENTFTVFSDGILMNKNISYAYFQLFPHAKYIWNDDKGFFNESTLENPVSFFGFSAYINNEENLGLICHLINEKIRINTFKNFNLQISPLSDREILEYPSPLPSSYIDILKNKFKFIEEYDGYNLENYNIFNEIISGRKEFKELIIYEDYLN